MKKFIVSLFTLTLFAVNMMAQCDVPGTVTATVRLVRKPNTLLHGQFSVASNRKVSFSKGNLQYVASPSAGWRFAAHQYDIEGSDNAYIASDYTDYIDLFGYGTSGQSQAPYLATTEASDYFASDLVGANKLYDWGRKNYTTGVDTAYRVLTAAEWKYLLTERTNYATRRGQATVAGVQGLVLLPDDWETPDGVSFTTSITNYESNVITAENWSKMEAAGAVFLPAAGYRSGTSVSSVGVTGNYWSTTAGKYITFTESTVTVDATTLTRPTGMSVRLVQTL